MQFTRAITTIAISACIALPALALGQSQDATFKAEFTAEYTMQFNAPTGKPSTAKGSPQPTAPQSLTIPGAGVILWSDPKLRIDLTNGLNQEAMRLHVDFEAGTAAMLYPDTLNGYKTDLKALDTRGYLPIARDFLSRRNDDATPKGFTKKELDAETIGGVNASHVKYSKEDGTVVHVWRRSNGDPLRLSATTSKGKLKLDFTSFKRGVKLEAKSFSIDKKYQIEDVKEPPSEFGNLS